MNYPPPPNLDRRTVNRAPNPSEYSSMSRSQRAAAAPPPPTASLSKQGYHTMSAITENALSASWAIPKKRSKTEEEYFDEDDEPPPPTSPGLDYIPAPGSPTHALYMAQKNAQPEEEADDSEDDPLDAYMAGIEQQVKRESEKQKQDEVKPETKGTRADIDEEDAEESYYRYMEENPRAGMQDDDSDYEIEYDEDGNPIYHPKKKIIDPLPPVDHSLIEYKEFNKNFYVEHEDIVSMSGEQVQELRTKLGIAVSGPNPPNPVTSFAHFGFDEALMKVIRKSEFSQPTPIQAQAVPAALSGRDIIGIAKTGSGKTAAFVWPMLVHIMDQRELAPGDGPIALVLAPTRELSVQIYNEVKRFGKAYNIQAVCAYGGGSKWEQSKALESGAEVVVATPGRMIDMVKIKATNLERVTFLVLDEADRMFDMGFEPQVRSICSHCRPDRQTLLFSATFKKKIERLARDALTDPVRMSQGDPGEANQDVTQNIVLMLQTNKLPWLIAHQVEFTSAGSVLIFVTKKINAEEVATQLRLKEIDCLLIHGDMDQTERNRVITSFKKKEVDILVATDVAARGLDIPHIRTVVNYDVARDIDTHTHRIGRTGRAGEKGTAYTLVTSADKEFAGHLVRNLEGANQHVPDNLLELANQSAWFRKSRFKQGKAKNLNVGGAGLGFRERSGLPPPVKASPPSSNLGNLHTNESSPKKPAPTRGPGQDRLSAMKSAFKAQYQSQFTAAVDNSWQQTIDNPKGAPTRGPIPDKKVKKSRWE